MLARAMVAALCTLALSLFAGCAQVTPTGAPADTVRVSGPSPFANCTMGGQGTRYAGAEVETWLAVNPAALKKGKVEYLGVWMSDRWSNGGGSGLEAASSFDGGATWSRVPLAFGGCAENGLWWDAGRVSDPWVTFGPDGIAYASGLIIDTTLGRWAIAAASSRDGGRTWSDYTIVESEQQRGQVALDKEAVTADPTRPGTAYLVYNRNDKRELPLRSQVHLSITTDGGKTWGKPRVIFEAPRGEVPVGNTITVDPRSGVLYNLFRWAVPTEKAGEYATKTGLQRSADGGQTWTEARVIMEVVDDEVIPPDGSTPVRTGALPLLAVDPGTGRLYMVWGDSRFQEDLMEIALAYSDDQGETWSEPLRVNPAESRGAFRPTIAVNDQGQVAISYYDFREQGESQAKLPAHLWLALYRPTAEGLGQAKETHIAGPFDLAMAPMAPGPFLGDYLGLVPVNNAFTLFYVITTEDPANPTDVFVRTIKP